jgi:hypothetical protein
MRQLRDDTHLILDGEVRVYRRERSKRWQAAIVIDGHWSCHVFVPLQVLV